MGGRKGWEKRISETSKDDTARRQEKPKTKAEKKLVQVRSSGTHTTQTLKKHDPNNTRWSQDEHQEMVKSLCTQVWYLHRSPQLAPLPLSLSLSLSLFCLSFSLPLQTTQHKTNKQTNNVTLVSRVCTVAPVRVLLLRARSDEYPCPRRVESRVGQGGREGGK